MNLLFLVCLCLNSFTGCCFGQTEACGFVTTVSEVVQTFSSPNWPQPYPNNADCFWNFSTTTGSRIKVNFLSFSTEDCCDSLSVIEESGEVLNIHGNLTIQESLVSSTNWIAFRFISDEATSYQGFQANFAITDEPSRLNILCGFTAEATSTEQSLTSPGWPLAYVDDLFCTWTITARPGYRIKVNITKFATEFCCDYFSVVKNNYELVRIKGDVSYIPPIISDDNRLDFEFYSDIDVVYNGFNATFVETLEEPYIYAPCGSENRVSSSLQDLFSPGYPGSYENNINCSWTITADAGMAIDISVVFLKVEQCCDILKIYDENHEVIFGVEPHMSESFLSTSNQVNIRFTSDYSKTDLGFQLAYKSIPSQDVAAPTPGQGPENTDQTVNDPVCGFGAIASSVQKSLTSPGWPNFYVPDESCEWTLQARPGLRIKITFLLFRTEECCDYLSIIENGEEILRLKGDLDIPSPVISRQNRLILIFRSDLNVNDQGFQATFEETNLPPNLPYAPCGGNFAAIITRQYLSSPGYPNAYGNDLNCTWRITTRLGYRIKIIFGLFDTESCCDYLEGFVENNQVFNSRGNDPGLSSYISPSNQMTLRFISDRNINGQGFQLTYFQTTEFSINSIAPCGFIKNASKIPQALNSPLWPAQYENNLDCQWAIFAKPNRLIQLRFLSFHTEACCDKLDIYDGETMILRLAGDISLNEPIRTSTDTLRLRFRTDRVITNSGFQAVFEEIRI